MSKPLSIIFLVLSCLSLICIMAFSESNLEAALGWAIIGSVIALGFSITGLAQSYKVKSIQKTMSVIGVVWSSICVILIFALSNDPLASSGWGLFSMAYAIPYAIVLLVKGKVQNSLDTSQNSNLAKIRELHELYKSGALTEEEFTKKKTELL